MTNTMTGTCFLSALGLMLVTGAVADEGPVATWADSGLRGNLTQRDYFQGTYWQDGVAPDLTDPVATNLTIRLDGAPTEAKRLQEIADGTFNYESNMRYFGLLSFRHAFTDTSNAPLYLGALEGGVWTRWDLWWTTWGYVFGLRDPSRYQGWFDVADRERGSYSMLHLLSTPAFTSVVNRACVSGSLGFKVPDGTHAVVKEVFGPGLLPVNSNPSNTKSVLPLETKGTLEVLNQPGPLTDVRVYNGELVLHGYDGPEQGEIAGVPALRLDASCAESLTITETDGRRYVEAWRDADGRSTFVANKVDANTRPFVSVDVDTGRNVVDFGSCGTNDTQVFGPAGRLTLNATLTGAREIHVVFRDHFRANTMPQLLGNDLSEWGRDWLRHFWGALFDAEQFSDTPALAGRTLFDGQTTSARARPETTLSLHAAASSLCDHEMNIKYIGMASKSPVWYGGAQIAELIVYTNELTVAERARTHRYLMRKWRPGVKTADYGSISLESASASLAVADGTLRVNELKLPPTAMTFTKKGAGTLEIGSLSPAGTQIVVQDGSVVLAPHVARTANPESPAADPVAWFDATHWQTDIEAASSEDEVTRVAVWHDRRGQNVPNAYGDVYTLRTADIGAVHYAPSTVDPAVSAAGGLPMVDCGPYVNALVDGQPPNAGTWLSFFRNGAEEKDYATTADTTDERHREMFIVFLKTDAQARPIGAHGNQIVQGADCNALAQRAYSYTRLIAGHWTLNGAWVDPNSAPYNVGEVQVVAFRAARPLAMNAFFRDRNYAQTCGGGKIGEIISYDRALTPQERRDTELYLLRKWRGAETHPGDACLADRVAYVQAAEESVTLGVGAGVSADAGAVDAAYFVKTGEGSLSASVDYEQVKTLRVEGGRLTLSYPLLQGALFHADATDLASMSFTVADDGATTNVSRWAGAEAVTSFPFSGTVYPTRLPRLVTDRAHANAPEMPYVDFGRFTTRESKTAEYLTDNMPKAASMNWPDLGPLQEFHIVLRDTETEDGCEQIIGTYNEGLMDRDNYPFLRTAAPLLSANWASWSLWDGYVAMDGTSVAPNTSANRDAHVYSFQPLKALPNRFAFAKRTGYHMGGQRVGECVAFARTNTVARRTQIQNYLRRKWLGDDLPQAERIWSLDSASCANGGVVSFGERTTVNVARLGGDGTIAFPNGGGVTNVSSLAFTVRNADDVDALVVQGTFAPAVSGTATVSLDLPSEVATSALLGDYTLLAATGFENFGNFAGWTFTVEGDAPRSVSPRLYAVAGRGIVLSFAAKGTMILLR